MDQKTNTPGTLTGAKWRVVTATHVRNSQAPLTRSESEPRRTPSDLVSTCHDCGRRVVLAYGRQGVTRMEAIIIPLFLHGLPQCNAFRRVNDIDSAVDYSKKCREGSTVLKRPVKNHGRDPG